MTRRRQRVLLLHYTSPSVLGGVEQVVGAHAGGLRAAGLDVRIVAGRGRAAPQGVEMVRIPELDSRHPAVLRDFRALASGVIRPEHARLAARIERALRSHVAHADRIVVHNAFTLHKNHALTVALARLAGEFRGRFVAWTHDLAWADAQYAGQRHDGAPWDLFARAVDGVRYVAVSEERARQLAALTGLRRGAITVVPNGIDLSAALGLSAAGAALARRLDLFAADPLLLLPVRLTRRKRVEAAIAATRTLRRVRPSAALVVTGTTGAHNDDNIAYAAELRDLAGPGVHLLSALGIRPTYRVIADLYALADALVLPSQSEGFGIPILEAGLARLPIVCSDLPPLRAIAGDAATYVPPDASGDTIAAAVERRLARDAAAQLRRRVKEQDWSRVIREKVLPAVMG